jgi:hypothetical protein
MAAMTQMMAFAQEVINNSTEKADRERNKEPKTLPETLLCRLLGLSGISWEDQAHLSPIWLTLHQQPDRATKAMALQVFFQNLGKQEPAFSQFHNTTLFEHITSYKFTPGAAYASCHHGISLLAVSMRSFAAQERESQDDEHFERATTKTPDAVRKHSEKAPPPLPTTIAELLQLLWRLIILTTGLFTTNCSLAIQLKDLYTALKKREQTIMGNTTSASELIPQIVWAITCASREFYGTISTREDVDPPDDGYGHGAPCFVEATLSIHMSLFKAGQKPNLENLPEQWRRNPTPAPAAAPHSGNRNSSNTWGEQSNRSRESDNRRYGGNPFRPDGGNDDNWTKRINHNPPAAFGNAADLTRLKENMRGITLSEIVKEANIRGGPTALDTTGWPNNTCLNWIIMGTCARRRCANNHPTSIDAAAATAVYKQLEPGIKRLLESKKQRRNGPGE